MYNIFNWLLIICKASYKFNSNFGKIVERLEKLAEQNKEFERDLNYKVQFISSDEIVVRTNNKNLAQC